MTITELAKICEPYASIFDNCNCAYNGEKKDRTDPEKALYVLTHIREFPELQSLRVGQATIDTIRGLYRAEIANQQGHELLDRAIKDAQYVQEIVIQRFTKDVMWTVIGAVTTELSTIVEEKIFTDIKANQYSPAIEKIIEQQKKALVGDVKKIKTFAQTVDVYQNMSLGNKLKLHAWAVILFAEAAYRCAIEEITYLIHQMAPDWFPDYWLLKHGGIVEIQRLSFLKMGEAIVDPTVVLREEIDNVNMGTLYGSEITAPCYPSNWWPKMDGKL